MSANSAGPCTELAALRASLVDNPRPVLAHWLCTLLRLRGAVKCYESVWLWKYTMKQDFVQFRVDHQDDEKRYCDPPVITLYEDGSWERV
jgi:hypothetical protein